MPASWPSLIIAAINPKLVTAAILSPMPSRRFCFGGVRVALAMSRGQCRARRQSSTAFRLADPFARYGASNARLRESGPLPQIGATPDGLAGLGGSGADLRVARDRPVRVAGRAFPGRE